MTGEEDPFVLIARKRKLALQEGGADLGVCVIQLRASVGAGRG